MLRLAGAAGKERKLSYLPTICTWTHARDKIDVLSLWDGTWIFRSRIHSGLKINKVSRPTYPKIEIPKLQAWSVCHCAEVLDDFAVFSGLANLIASFSKKYLLFSLSKPRSLGCWFTGERTIHFHTKLCHVITWTIELAWVVNCRRGRRQMRSRTELHEHSTK